MVEVFKTDIQEAKLANELTSHLHAHLPHCKINFDLQDCDRILRIEGSKIQAKKVIDIVNTFGFHCQLLE